MDKISQKKKIKNLAMVGVHLQTTKTPNLLALSFLFYGRLSMFLVISGFFMVIINLYVLVL